MKKLIGILLSILIIYCIYFDITVGTLPHFIPQEKVMGTAEKQVNIPYFETIVKPGDTLISIVEDKIKEPLPVPINQLIQDFQALNPGQTAGKIKIGSTYRFPDYKK